MAFQEECLSTEGLPGTVFFNNKSDKKIKLLQVSLHKSVAPRLHASVDVLDAQDSARMFRSDIIRTGDGKRESGASSATSTST